MKTRIYMIFRFASLILLLILAKSNCLSQDTIRNYKSCNYAKEPCWIKMMDDPNVNYFEAQKAYNEYWKANGGEPDASENFEQRKLNNAKANKHSHKQNKQQNTNQKYLVESKRFKTWLKEVEPYVQEDGSVLPREKRKEIFENSR